MKIVRFLGNFFGKEVEKTQNKQEDDITKRTEDQLLRKPVKGDELFEKLSELNKFRAKNEISGDMIKEDTDKDRLKHNVSNHVTSDAYGNITDLSGSITENNAIDKVKSHTNADKPFAQYSDYGRKIAREAYNNCFIDPDEPIKQWKPADEAREILRTGFQDIINSPDTTEDEKAIAKLGLVCNSEQMEQILSGLGRKGYVGMLRAAGFIMEAINKAFYAPAGVVMAQLSADAFGASDMYYNINGNDLKSFGQIKHLFLKAGAEAVIAHSVTTEKEKSIAGKVLNEAVNSEIFELNGDTLKNLTGKLSAGQMEFIKYMASKGTKLSEKQLTDRLSENGLLKIDERTIKRLEGRIPAIRLQTLDSHLKDVYYDEESLRGSLECFNFEADDFDIIKDYATRAHFTEQDIQTVMNNASNITDWYTGNSMSDIMRTIVSNSVTNHTQTVEQICKDVTEEVKRVGKYLKSIVSSGHIDDTIISIDEDKRMEISGNIICNETGEIMNFNGCTKDCPSGVIANMERHYTSMASTIEHGDRRWQMVSYKKEEGVKITEETIKQLEGKVNTKPLKEFLNKEYVPEYLEVALQSTKGIWPEEVKEITKNLARGEIRERYDLKTSRRHYTVWVDKDGKMELSNSGVPQNPV